MIYWSGHYVVAKLQHLGRNSISIRRNVFVGSHLLVKGESKALIAMVDVSFWMGDEKRLKTGNVKDQMR